MGTFWNAKIETKTARSKYNKDRERKVFIIRINSIRNVPFKIKTSRNDELFSTHAEDFLKNMYSNTFGNGHVGTYWKCAYHGRTKKMSLYVVGCNKFTGLLIIDEDLYSLMPVGVSNNAQIYRLDLLNSTVKLNILTQTNRQNSFITTRSIKSLPTSTQSTPKSISVNLNIDKSHFTNGVLTNSNQLNVYFNNLVIQSHLTWAYFYHEHEITLRFDQISWQTDLKAIGKKPSLFNINPNDLNKPRNNSIQQIFNSLYDKQPINAINIFFLQPSITETDHFDGIASRATKTPLACPNQATKSLIILKEKEYKDVVSKKPEPSRFLKLAIEQANVLIDLIGENFGNIGTNRRRVCRQLEPGEFNWYFQTPYNGVDDSQEQSNEYAVLQETCINRSIKLASDCDDMQVPRSYCGNGAVEDSEECDCDINDLLCQQCCDVNTCKFKSSTNKCSTGKCCDNNCQLKPRNTLCRSSKNTDSCDWPEYCTGESSSCPVDSQALDGIQCPNGNSQSHCWNGECINVNEQCELNWSGKNSDMSCYESFNVIGFQNGNCGHNGTHYKPCSHIDAQCGLLNCQFGADKPLINADAFFKATTNIRGATNECKIITSNPMVFVRDGSHCMLNSESSGLCFNRKCTPLETIIQPTTNNCYNPKTKALCSNNGICTNNFKCICNSRWSGDLCDQFLTGNDMELNSLSYTPSIETSGFNNESYKSAAFFSIVGGVGSLLLVIFMLMFLFCRRRRSINKSSSKFQTLDTVDGFTTNTNPPRVFTSSHNSHQNSALSLNQSTSSTSQNLSITQVNHAIKQLKVKPSKSILKKKNTDASAASSPTTEQPLTVIDAASSVQTALVPAADTSMNDSSMKFERQVNINTILNSAIGTGHRSSRRSLNNDRRSRFDESYSSSSSIDSHNDSHNSDDSISSNLSNQKLPEVPKGNKLPDLSFLTSSGSSAASTRRNSSESSISLQLLEQKQAPDEQKSDFLKVQDYLNELDILSQQTTFRAENETTSKRPLSAQTLINNDEQQTKTTPQRPQSLLTPIKQQNRLSQILTPTLSQQQTPTNPGKQMLLHLQILKQQQNNPTDDLLNLYTNSSETSSGYMSNSTQNLNGINNKKSNQQQQQPDASSHNTSTCSSSLTPPMPACLLNNTYNNNTNHRFSYMAASAGSNNTLSVLDPS